MLIILFHGNNGNANAPQCYFIAECLVLFFSMAIRTVGLGVCRQQIDVQVCWQLDIFSDDLLCERVRPEGRVIVH